MLFKIKMVVMKPFFVFVFLEIIKHDNFASIVTVPCELNEAAVILAVKHNTHAVL